MMNTGTKQKHGNLETKLNAMVGDMIKAKIPHSELQQLLSLAPEEDLSKGLHWSYGEIESQKHQGFSSKNTPSEVPAPISSFVRKA